MSTIARRLILKDNHPTMVKFNKLSDLAAELGISVSFCGHRTIVEDNERDNSLPTLYMEDIETNDSMGEFPPAIEFKLVYDNPAYLKQQKEECDNYRRTQEEAAAKKKKADELAEEERKERAAKEKEKAEKKLLAELKAKYGD